MGEAAVTPAEIIRDAADAWALTIPDVTGTARDAKTVRGRFLAIALIQAVYPSYTTAAIAALLCRSDHGSVCNALAKFRAEPEDGRQKKLFRALLLRYGVAANPSASHEQ